MTKHASPYGSAAVKNGLIAFLLGRGLSAVFTFAAFSFAAHTLELREYGYYVAVIALVELLLALSTGGIDWVAARILPESRMHASGRDTTRLVASLFSLQSGIYLVSGGLVWLTAEWLGQLLSFPASSSLIRLSSFLILIEGIGRLARDQMLGILMEQRYSQIAQICKSGSFLFLMAITSYNGEKLDAAVAIKYELLSAALAAVIGGAFLARAMARIYSLSANRPNWTLPPFRELFRLASHTYISYLFSLAYSPQILTMLIASVMGVESVAVFGFARGFADQVRRYLPTDLLQSVIRPALIAFYSNERDFGGFSLRLVLWFKSSLIVLFPLLLFFGAFGHLGMRAIGGDRFIDAWITVLILLFGTAAMSFRRVLELAANTVQASDLIVRAALILICVPLIIFIELRVWPNIALVVFCIVCSEWFFCIRVLRGLSRRGFHVPVDSVAYLRLIISWSAALIILRLLDWQFGIPTIFAIILSIIFSIFALLAARPLNAKEGGFLISMNPRLGRFFHRTMSYK